jgi:glycosyltransferase involved in cell wall biosynthesis
MKKITVITPCFNEEENVELCAQELRQLMATQLPSYDYEHIFADNASTDRTFELLKIMALEDDRIKVILNSRNIGPFRNIWNAMKSASGDAIIPMLPADLQDPPQVISEFVRKWEEGSLVVYGVRQSREESIFLRLSRGLYYRTIRKFASTPIPINSGEFLLADRRVISSILSVDDEYPYIRGLIAQTGVKSSAVPYKWVKRVRGSSKNSLFSLIDQAINGPARVSLLGGFIFSFLGLAYAGFTTLNVWFSSVHVPIGIPTIIVGIFLLGGIQLFFLGLLGEYILSIHSQVRRLPPMFELERINF